MGRRRRRRRDHVKFKLIFCLPESVSSRRLSSNPPRLARGLLLGLALVLTLRSAPLTLCLRGRGGERAEDKRRSSGYTCGVVALAVRVNEL